MYGESMSQNNRNKIVVIIIGLGILASNFYLPQVQGKTPTNLSINTFSNGLNQVDLDSNYTSLDETRITIEQQAAVLNASMNISTPDQGGYYPVNPYLKIGNSEIWRYNGTGYGDWGLQQEFSNGNRSAKIRLMPNVTEEISIKMPAGSQEVTGSIGMRMVPERIWENPYEVSPNNKSSVNIQPVIYNFRSITYMVWSSNDSNLTDGPDKDIFYRWFDGKTWSPVQNLSQPFDEYEERAPILIEYNDALYCIWSSTIEDVYNSDYDIIMRWSTNGKNWSNEIVIASGAKAGEKGFYTFELFNKQLFSFWRAENSYKDNRTGENGIDIVYRTWDGSKLSEIRWATSNQDGSVNMRMDTAVFEDRLYLFWERINVNGSRKIYYEYFDNPDWIGPFRLSTINRNYIEDGPAATVWFNPLDGVYQLFVAWESIYEFLLFQDRSIVVKRLDPISGWSDEVIVDGPHSEVAAIGPGFVDYKGNLYLFLTVGLRQIVLNGTGLQDHEADFRGVIDVVPYDGAGWGPIDHATLSGEDGNASNVAACMVNDSLFFIWEDQGLMKGINWNRVIVFREMRFARKNLDLYIGKDNILDYSGAIGPEEQAVRLFPQAVTTSIGPPYTIDEFQNQMATVPVRIKSQQGMNLTITNLSVEYQSIMRLNITKPLSDTLTEIRNRSSESFPTRKSNISVFFGTDNGGQLTLKNLSIEYFINLPPVLVKPIPTQYLQEDSPELITLYLKDVFIDDFDSELNFNVSPVGLYPPVNISLYGDILNISTAGHNWNGYVNITVIAEDDWGFQSRPSIFKMIVLPVNDPPVINSNPVTVGRTEQPYIYEVNATDVDKDRLFYSLGEGPKGMTIESDTGVIKWKPAIDQAGKNAVTVTVSDGNISVNQTFSIDVKRQVEKTIVAKECPLAVVLVIITIIVLVIFKETRQKGHLKK